MSSDVHLGGRPAAGGKIGRKAGYDLSGGFEYYGEEGQEWWDEEGTSHAGYDPMAAGHHWSYYDEFSADHDGGYNNFEVDLRSMVFVLTESLEPQDFYLGLDFDEKSLMFSLQDEDIDEQCPPAWKSRPLKIHPEPALRTERKESSAIGVSESASSLPVTQSSSPGPTPPGGSPVPGQNHRDGIVLPNPRSGIDGVPRSGIEASTPVSEDAVTPTNSGNSPKIVISNSQLEHLKQKMQALKQRRSITPMVSGHDETAGVSVAPETENNKEANSRGAKEKPPITSNCPGSHGLKMFNTPEQGWWCSVCETTHPKGTPFFGCRECDYDECEVCARAPVGSKKKKKPEKKQPSRSSSPRDRSASPQPSPPTTRKKKAAREERAAASSESAAAEKKAAEEPEDSPSEDIPLRREPRREKRREEEEPRREAKRTSKAKPADEDRREARVERVEKRGSGTKDADRDGRVDEREASPEPKEKRARSTKDADRDVRTEAREAGKVKAAARRESTAATSSAQKPRTAGASLAAAARAAAASAAGSRNAQAASPASDEGSSSEEEYQAPREKGRAAVRDSRLVPRERRQAHTPEHWDPRDRQEDREDSEPASSPEKKVVGRGVRMRSDQPRTEVSGVKRRAPPERSAPLQASRSRSASEEPPPKKRAGNSALVGNEESHARGSTSSSRAPVRALVSSEEGPRAARRAAAAPVRARGESGNDLLRRVLGANRMGFGAAPAKRPVRGPAAIPAKEMSPEPARKSPSPKRTNTLLKSSAREGPPMRPASAAAGIRKALESVKNQESRGRRV